LGRQEPDAAGEEGPVRAHRVDDVRVAQPGLLAKLPVGREVVLAAQPVVVHAGDMRDGDVKVRHTCSFVNDRPADKGATLPASPGSTGRTVGTCTGSLSIMPHARPASRRGRRRCVRLRPFGAAKPARAPGWWGTGR